ncbi:hypothetical protein N8I77_002443 [Diaporthe amygdali]|uniref:S-adenosyl-L-methionine-dependent methyltransferase n=1 Tax=Phomopsis amygdali TaxID=1214568 RepID=A0AAD9W941_PHOAM|nr:uncharacterized protein J7T55_001157 [Diaporthe amygdali]KAJ0120299.1 hypothetical protein J7T55_001157 [Diaporthe amygdali]KAK2615707.1 hypothetical protein N8I77_002443 [Diaporthe amygdali]
MASPDTTTARGLLPPAFWVRLKGYIGLRDRFQPAAWYYIRSVWASLRRGQLSVLFGGNDVREHSFAEFYQDFGHHFAAYEATTPVPSLVASAHGVVLDLGPGTGNQLNYFDRTRVAHVYGVEPNTLFAPRFAERLRDTALGQDGKYTLINCGIEDGEALARHGVVEGSVDCVVSMQVMCSLPDVEEQARHMYRLLKPGGELIFWEHCRNTDAVTRAVQWLWCLLWPTVIGGCRLDRVTKEALVGAGPWERVEIKTEMQPQDLMPRISGRLIKPAAA